MDFVFPKDELKEKVQWVKNRDFMDGSPRYTFEGRDPQDTYERFQVVVYAERERRFSHDPSSVCNAYYGYVRDNEREYSDTVGPFYSVKTAKKETLDLFNQYMRRFFTEIKNDTVETILDDETLHQDDGMFMSQL